MWRHLSSPFDEEDRRKRGHTKLVVPEKKREAKSEASMSVQPHEGVTGAKKGT